MNIQNNFTFAFICCPGRSKEIVNALNSLKSINNNHGLLIDLYYNPGKSEELDQILDLYNFENTNMCLTIAGYDKFTSIAKCWNDAIKVSTTPYIILSNDDTIYHDKDILEKIYQKHLEGWGIVNLTEGNSAFSVDKKIFDITGYFDENYLWSWEDIDFDCRRIQLGIKKYQFSPYIVQHLHSPIGRDQNKWDKSAEYFSKKWGLNKTPQELMNMIVSGEFNKINRMELKMQIQPVEEKKKVISVEVRNCSLTQTPLLEVTTYKGGTQDQKELNPYVSSEIFPVLFISKEAIDKYGRKEIDNKKVIYLCSSGLTLEEAINCTTEQYREIKLKNLKAEKERKIQSLVKDKDILDLRIAGLEREIKDIEKEFENSHE